MNRWNDMEQLQYQADIYYWEESGMDEWGNPAPPEKVFVAQDLEVDFQPLTGQRRSASSGTEYESSHKLFILDPDLLEGSIQEGMKVAVRRGGEVIGQFVVVFVPDYIHHLEVEVTRDA